MKRKVNTTNPQDSLITNSECKPTVEKPRTLKILVDGTEDPTQSAFSGIDPKISESIAKLATGAADTLRAIGELMVKQVQAHALQASFIKLASFAETGRKLKKILTQLHNEIEAKEQVAHSKFTFEDQIDETQRLTLTHTNGTVFYVIFNKEEIILRIGVEVDVQVATKSTWSSAADIVLAKLPRANNGGRHYETAFVDIYEGYDLAKTTNKISEDLAFAEYITKVGLVQNKDERKLFNRRLREKRKSDGVSRGRGRPKKIT